MELTKADPKKIFFKYLFTALGSTIITSIYSSVDMICVGHHSGAVASAAISCMNPLWSVMICFGLLLGIGGSVLMSNLRGAGRTQEGDEHFTISVIGAAAVSIVLMLCYIVFLRPLLRFFGADDIVLPYAESYTVWIALAVPAFIMGTTLSSFVRNDGAPGVCTAAILSGGAFNVFGDVFFVFGLDMGMSGAGLATALGQVIACVILCIYLFSKKCTLHFRRPAAAAKKLRSIVSTGFAPFIVDLSFGVTVLLFNRQIVRYAGNTELAVFGTVATVAILFQSLFYGVGQAIQPIVSVNNGAGLGGRVAQIRRYAITAAIVMSLLFFALTELFPGAVLRLYMAPDEAVMAIGPGIMRIYNISLLFMGINVVASYYLQSILYSVQSIIISLSRGFVLCALFILLLPAAFGFDAIWLSMPLAEFFTAIYAVCALIRSAGKPA